jgi:8-oxo-dGTP diphosphatase
MEMCDVHDESGTHTGRIVARGTDLPQGQYYLVVQVWIRNESGEYLIQQRAPHLISGPGIWATTAGYVLAGEESISGAIREVNEELGLQLSPVHFTLYDRHILENRIEDVWFADVSSDVIGAPNLGPEVSDWKWVSKSELGQMVSTGDFFAYSYIDRILE